MLLKFCVPKRPVVQVQRRRSWARHFYQMLRLFSFSSRCLATTSLTLPLSLRRFVSQSIHEEDIYDPPFSPFSKPPNPEKPKNKTSKEAVSVKEDPKFPLRSDLPFDFKYSYSEINDSVEPISFRESPKFSPFGPGRLDRKWTGTSAPVQEEVDRRRLAEERNRVFGDPLSEEEVAELVERYRHSDCARQINLGISYFLKFLCKKLCAVLGCTDAELQICKCLKTKKTKIEQIENAH